jgi:predicted enzyme related to lactoylglutathione lyase
MAGIAQRGDLHAARGYSQVPGPRRLEVAAMGGRVVHFEIPADDLARAQEFYRSAFGWEINSMPGVDYALASTTPTDDQGMPTEPGAINGGLLTRQEPVTSTVVTIDVEDIDKALDTISSLGGSTVRGKEAVMDIGFAAYFRDCEGNLMGLWQSIG